jgi:ubiquinone/menaquinone biosynthesis C-methylase UbiE
MAQHQQPEIRNNGFSGSPEMPGGETGKKDGREQGNRNGKALLDWRNDITMQAVRHHYFLQAQQGNLHPASVPVGTMEQVLDFGCGSGEWIFDLVKRYPGLKKVVGIDPHQEAITSATVRRNLAGLSQVTLLQADIMSPLPFADRSFDLVHMRNWGYSFRATQWPALLSEFTRVLKPGGWLAFVVAEFGEVSSPAMMRIEHLMAQFLSKMGLGMDNTRNLRGPAAYIYGILLDGGFEDVSYDLSLLDGGFQGGTMADILLSKLVKQATALKEHAVQVGLLTAAEFDEMILQAEQEIQAPDRCAWAILVSAYGRREVP